MPEAQRGPGEAGGVDVETETVIETKSIIDYTIGTVISLYVLSRVMKLIYRYRRPLSLILAVSSAISTVLFLISEVENWRRRRAYRIIKSQTEEPEETFSLSAGETQEIDEGIMIEKTETGFRIIHQ